MDAPFGYLMDSRKAAKRLRKMGMLSKKDHRAILRLIDQHAGKGGFKVNTRLHRRLEAMHLLSLAPPTLTMH